MAVLQYVGARYVPKLFDDGKGGMEWQANTYYEPLTIVTYNNTSYISRGPVAASVGNPAVNGSYWAETGNYNAYIQSLVERIAGARAELEAVKDREKKTFVFIGDSYNAVPATSWVSYAMECMGIPEERYYNFSTPGGGIVRSGENGTYIQVLNANLSSIQKKENVTNVVITTAYNDTGSTPQQLYDAMKELVGAIQSSFPYAKIQLAFVGALPYLNKDRRRQVLDIISTLTGNNYGYGVIKNTEYIFMNSSPIYIQDYHPTSTGARLLGGFMAEGIINGCVNVYWPEVILNNTIGWGVKTALVNETVYLIVQNGIFTPTEDIKAGIQTNIGTYNNAGYTSYSGNSIKGGVSFMVDVSPNGDTHIQAQIILSENQIIIASTQPLTAGTRYNIFTVGVSYPIPALWF